MSKQDIILRTAVEYLLKGYSFGNFRKQFAEEMTEDEAVRVWSLAVKRWRDVQLGCN